MPSKKPISALTQTPTRTDTLQSSDVKNYEIDRMELRYQELVTYHNKLQHEKATLNN
jgi:hypothetical protein